MPWVLVSEKGDFGVCYNTPEDTFLYDMFKSNLNLQKIMQKQCQSIAHDRLVESFQGFENVLENDDQYLTESQKSECQHFLSANDVHFMAS